MKKCKRQRCVRTQMDTVPHPSSSNFHMYYYNLRLEIPKKLLHNIWASPRNISSIRFLFRSLKDFLRSNQL